MLTLSQDLDQIAQAITSLLQDAESETFDGFDNGPIRGVALMDALFDKLAIDYTPAPAALKLQTESPVEAEPDTRASAFLGHSVLELLQRHCATCHRSNTQSPPGFLVGNVADVLANLRSCADRISYRLAMWQTDAVSQTKTPMPPAAYLRARSIDVEQWVNSTDYKTLRSFADGLRSASDAPLLATDYAALQACMPVYERATSPRSSMTI